MRPRIVGAILFISMIFSANFAFGISFMVKPMKVEAGVKAGQRVRIPIDVRNISGDGTVAEELTITLLELTQRKNGIWQALEPGKKEENSTAASMLDWMTTKSDTINVSAMETETVEVIANIPRNAQGYYFAAIYIRQSAAEDSSVQFAFLIPVIFEIKGRPIRQKVNMTDVNMEFLGATTDHAATTTVTLEVGNIGRSYSKLKGNIRVDAFVKDRWIKITTKELEDVSIIPGVNLELTSDLQKRLPSGKYRLTGSLYVDGRRLRPLEKEIEFDGDPSMDMLAVDSALILDPPELFVTSATGAFRTTIIKLENASTDMVEIETASAMPDSLKAVAIGDVTGNDLSCDEWIRISPKKFRIRGGAKQNVRVVTSIPKEEERFPNYYGLLTLKAKYPDGQSAGETQSLVCLSNMKVKSEYKGKVINLSLDEGEDNTYFVKSRCANIGNVHYTPEALAWLDTAMGERVKTIKMPGDTGLMLPMDVRDYAGELDLSDVEPGLYELTAGLAMGKEGGVTKKLSLEIKKENGKKVVEMIEVKDDQPAKEPPPVDPLPEDEKPKDQTS